MSWKGSRIAWRSDRGERDRRYRKKQCTQHGSDIEAWLLHCCQTETLQSATRSAEELDVRHLETGTNMDDMETLRRKAEAGSCVAQTVIGLRYLQGDGTPIDFVEALRFLSAASVQGGLLAIVHLADMRRHGLGGSVDMPEALRLYGIAARRGDFFAQIELGRIYSTGVDVPPDPSRAATYYQAALDQEAVLHPCDELEEARRFLMSRTTSE
jgi:TPR repeat protein